MAFLRRFFANINIFPVGSSYRLKVPLPSLGECWFTVDSSQDVTSFLQEIKQEDPHIFEINSNGTGKLFKEAVQQEITLSINNTEYRLKKTVLSQSNESKPISDSFIETLENTKITSKSQLKEHIHRNLTELGEQFGYYLKALENSERQINNQIKDIKEKEQQIARKIEFKSNFLCGMFLSVLSIQWGFFYYTIYEVDWLGWDLMEPITFSVGQLGFIISLRYYLKTQASTSYENVMGHYKDKERRMFLKQHGVNVGKIKFLEEEKNRITSLKEVIKKRQNLVS
ncbi:hypothetical protein SteCoe_18288 [Stentor coeruleus]|uniref:Calcium uniporter protein C-terminal domain-containing protein n=1 Tax=Stentor coeruleus TaxID=5963 RepID=A0A1R2BX04_9CILI|nr:hypothetical protein SteCoe_18288 [Stentor coeruleus]